MSSHTSISSKSGFRIYAQLCPRTPAKKSDPFSAKVKLSHSKNMSDFEYTCSGIGLPISQGNGLERWVLGPPPRCGRMAFPLRLLALPLWSICPPGCSLPLGGRCVLLVAPSPHVVDLPSPVVGLPVVPTSPMWSIEILHLTV